MKKNLRHGSGISVKDIKRRISQKPKKILVPIDGSPNSFRALNYSIVRAQSSGHKIIGLFVISLGVYSPHRPLPEVEKILKKDAARFLVKAKKKCSDKNVIFYYKIVFGNPGKKIVEFAKKNKINEIVIGHGNKGKLESLFLGSTSNYVIHKINIPVTLIK